MKRVRGALCAVFGSATLACLGASPAAAYEPRVPETFFGTSAPELWALTEQGRYAARDAQLDQIKAAGLDWARIEIGWPETEPKAPAGGVHSYDWRDADSLVTAMASRGLELMAMPMATPNWAKGSSAIGAGCPERRGEPASARAGDYAAFVGAIARRYGPSGTFWAAHPSLPKVPITRFEIWNEPNYGSFWCPEPNPELFASFLRQAADRIHAVDPGADVIVGGLVAAQDSRHEGDTVTTMAADDFMRRAVAAEPSLVSAVDMAGFHAYDLDPTVNLSLIGWFRRELSEIGMAKHPIALTEFGWTVGIFRGGITEDRRAKNYTTMANQLPRTDCGIAAVAAHTWQTRELDPLNPSHWYGITSPLTGLLHPSGAAYRDQVALFEGRGPSPAPRTLIEQCNATAPPDQDGDGVPDEDDDYPLDPDLSDGSGEIPPPAPDELPDEPRTHTQRTHDDFFGATLVRLPDDFSRLDEEFLAMRSARIRSARMRVAWAWIEPVPPTHAEYNLKSRWSWMDRVVLKLGQAGIRFVPAFGALPDWASPSGSEFQNQYAALMRRFAERYGVGGTFWAENGQLDDEQLAVREYEVWQFGNAPAHGPDGTASPAWYATTYGAVRAALRAVDPGALAVASLVELGPDGRAGGFLRDMVAANPALAGNIDAVHVFAEHSRTVSDAERALRDVRIGLEDTGNPAAPIFLGFGAPTGGPEPMAEAARAQFFATLASRSARGDCGLGGIFAHAWTTPEDNPESAYSWFGIASPVDATLYETAVAYRDTAGLFGGYGPAEAPAAAVHPCVTRAPDSDGDGAPDPADPAPLDPDIAKPTAAPPPAPTIGGGPASPTASRTATFSLAASGAVSFQCRLDDARMFEPCGSGVSYSKLAHGEHRVTVRAVDTLGLVGPEAVRRWRVDLVGPTITSLSGPDTVSLDGRVSLSFTADDPDARFACLLDGGWWEWCTSPKVYPAAGDGPHEFRVRAVDPLGNVGALAMRTFEVRTVPGAVSITAGPAEGGLGSPTSEFGFRADHAASYECRFDGAAWVACASGRHAPANPLSAGPHVFEVRGVGGSGKRGAVSARAFTVDAEGPKLKIVRKKLKRKGAATFKLRVADPAGVTSVKCSVDGGAFKKCATPHRLRGLKSGKHKLRVSVTDGVGNTRRASHRWRVRR